MITKFSIEFLFESFLNVRKQMLSLKIQFDNLPHTLKQCTVTVLHGVAYKSSLFESLILFSFQPNPSSQVRVFIRQFSKCIEKLLSAAVHTNPVQYWVHIFQTEWKDVQKCWLCLICKFKAHTSGNAY